MLFTLRWMNPTLKTLLNVVLDLYQAGKGEMQRRKIPLWVAPLILVLLIGGCNMARGRGAISKGDIRAAAQMCYEEYAHRYGDGRFRVRHTITGRTGESRHPYVNLNILVSEGSLDCVVMDNGNGYEIGMFKVW